MKNVFIIGSKGIPAKYGGFETFVDELTRRKKNEDIQYHISCMADNNNEFYYNGARCFNVKTPDVGSAKAVLYDILSLSKCLSYIQNRNLKGCLVYILACRIGPFMSFYKRKLEKLGVKVYVNPDGHEWKRSKWNRFIRTYWKLSERLMVKYSDLLICDSKGIEKYIRNDYTNLSPNTTFIAYGSDVSKSSLSNDAPELINWYTEHGVKANNYYLIVGRFVPENNYEIMIKEFMASDTNNDLVIISNVEENDFYKALLNSTNFLQDQRIKFVGTIYEQELLKKVREQAYGYLHGHEVGGTNPSLLEALASTKINLLLDVVFNREVGEDGALYFTKENGSLSNLIDGTDYLSKEKINLLQSKAKRRIIDNYSWSKIVSEYEEIFLKSNKNNLGV